MLVEEFKTKACNAEIHELLTGMRKKDDESGKIGSGKNRKYRNVERAPIFSCVIDGLDEGSIKMTLFIARI